MTSKTKIRGVVLHDWQIRALLDDRLSMFVVPIKPRDKTWTYSVMDDPDGVMWLYETDSMGDLERSQGPHQPGDVLYVKETWMPTDSSIVYRADAPSDWEQPEKSWWRPPQHMTEADSRPLRLKVTSVTVGLLRKINIEDFDDLGMGDMLKDPDSIMGIAFDRAEHAGIGGVPMRWDAEIYGFAALWDSRYGKTKHAWEHNPWRWTFRIRKLS